MARKQGSDSYGADQIKVLEGLEAPRMRPGMYIGSTEEAGLHHLLWEVVDNSVDEAMGGYCDEISVTLNSDNSITVTDNGRGIPVEKQTRGAAQGKSTLEVVLTTLHAGGKFDNDGYAFSGGLHGVGISVVNALSLWTRVQVKRDGAQYEMTFGQGDDDHPAGGALTPLKKAKTRLAKDDTGTSVTFLPDESIFTVPINWNISLIRERLRNTSYLNAGLAITLDDKRNELDETHEEFYAENGLQDFMQHLAEERVRQYAESQSISEEACQPVSPAIILGGAVDRVGEWEVCLQWFDDPATRVRSFANGINTPDGGTHVDGLYLSLTRILNNWARQNGILGPNDPNLEAADVRAGLGAIVAVRLPDLTFEGQTKGRLRTDSAKGMVRSGVNSQLVAWCSEHPVEIGIVLEKAASEMRLRKRLESEADKARQEQKAVGIESANRVVPSKLKDCETKDRSEAELFIVEGDSAGGTVQLARSRRTQAFLPIRGKILNVEQASRNSKEIEKDAVYRNNEVQDIINSIGAGSEDFFEIDKMRFGKIVILADADNDGRHIQLLLTTLFYRLMPGLIEAGHLYVARTPLFSCVIKGQKHYIYNTLERARFEEEHGPQFWTRYKGLGEMDADQLEEAALNPATRKLARLVIEDPDEAEVAVQGLQGKTTVSYRFEVLGNTSQEELELL